MSVMGRLTSMWADQSGFTLAELLVAIVILGVIMAPIAATLITFLLNTAATQQRLEESHDAQIAAAYFANDVQSAAVTGTVLGSSGNYDLTCHVSGATKLMQFQWAEYDVSDTMTAYNLASYEIQPSTGAGIQPTLHRVNCRGPAPGSTPQSSDVIIAHYLSSSLAPVPCGIGSPCPNGPANTVGLTVTEQDGYQFFVFGFGRSRG